MAMYHTQLKKDIAVHPWLSLSHLACTFCYWAIGHSPVHSSKHTTLPDDELQKTCRLLPSNNKISAANLENRRRGQRGTACHWCNQGNLSAYRTIGNSSWHSTAEPQMCHQASKFIANLLCACSFSLTLTKLC